MLPRAATTSTWPWGATLRMFRTTSVVYFVSTFRSWCASKERRNRDLGSGSVYRETRACSIAAHDRLVGPEELQPPLLHRQPYPVFIIKRTKPAGPGVCCFIAHSEIKSARSHMTRIKTMEGNHSVSPPPASGTVTDLFGGGKGFSHRAKGNNVPYSQHASVCHAHHSWAQRARSNQPGQARGSSLRIGPIHQSDLAS